ncbi:hypothetical protein [Balneatrix alpica]|uniref:Uncharacterized protein n=1 Tax=Balneatrix alpica TaxID=75684 RepID=A0ABV5ZC69_9GAMM|nr:hypothetical protein [Balneatrix alpica]
MEAKKSGAYTSVSISTRLHRGVIAKREDMRRNMCGMLDRVLSGAEGESIAKKQLLQKPSNAATEMSAIDLARDLFRLKKRVGGDQSGADAISARFVGQRYVVDGQIYEPLDQGSRVDIWYRTYKEPGFLNSIEDQNSVYWATIVCQMNAGESGRALKLQGYDWAKLEGVVSHYELGTPDRFVLKECKFK